jgi:hypothetical protein
MKVQINSSSRRTVAVSAENGNLAELATLSKCNANQVDAASAAHGAPARTRAKLIMFDNGSVLQTVSDVGSIVERFSKPTKLHGAMGLGSDPH